MQVKRLMKEIEVIAVFDEEGGITPLKFKLKSPGGDHVIKIDKIVYRNMERLAGNNMMLFDCLSADEGKKRQLQLKYELKTCKWFLYKM